MLKNAGTSTRLDATRSSAAPYACTSFQAEGWKARPTVVCARSSSHPRPGGERKTAAQVTPRDEGMRVGGWPHVRDRARPAPVVGLRSPALHVRSEERRVGKGSGLRAGPRRSKYVGG